MIWKLFVAVLILGPLIWIAWRLFTDNMSVAQTNADAVSRNDWIEILGGELDTIGYARVIGTYKEGAANDIVACIGVLQAASYQDVVTHLKKIGEYIEVNDKYFAARMLLGAIPNEETALSVIEDSADIGWAKSAVDNTANNPSLPRLLVAVGLTQHLDAPEAVSEFERIWKQAESS